MKKISDYLNPRNMSPSAKKYVALALVMGGSLGVAYQLGSTSRNGEVDNLKNSFATANFERTALLATVGTLQAQNTPALKQSAELLQSAMGTMGDILAKGPSQAPAPFTKEGWANNYSYLENVYKVHMGLQKVLEERGPLLPETGMTGGLASLR